MVTRSQIVFKGHTATTGCVGNGVVRHNRIHARSTGQLNAQLRHGHAHSDLSYFLVGITMNQAWNFQYLLAVDPRGLPDNERMVATLDLIHTGHHASPRNDIQRIQQIGYIGHDFVSK